MRTLVVASAGVALVIQGGAATHASDSHGAMATLASDSTLADYDRCGPWDYTPSIIPPTVAVRDRIRLHRGEKKAVVKARVEWEGCSGEYTEISNSFIARRQGQVVATGVYEVTLPLGRYQVEVVNKWVSYDGATHETVYTGTLEVLPAAAPRRPVGASGSVGVPAYFGFDLAYLFDPFGEYPVTMGGNTTSVKWPRSLALGEGVWFESLRWKSWTRSGAFGVGVMASGRERKVRLYFDEARTIRCRSTSTYSDTVSVTLFSRFGWLEGLKHVRINNRWMKQNRWYYLQTPDEVYRKGETYEC